MYTYTIIEKNHYYFVYMRKIQLSEKDLEQLSRSLKKIRGQLDSIIKKVELGDVNEMTFAQLLAVKGGVSRVCKDIIVKGVVPHIQDYSPREIDGALNIIFKVS